MSLHVKTHSSCTKIAFTVLNYAICAMTHQMLRTGICWVTNLTDHVRNIRRILKTDQK